MFGWSVCFLVVFMFGGVTMLFGSLLCPPLFKKYDRDAHGVLIVGLSILFPFLCYLITR